MIASISTTCNLYCKGCYARANQSCGNSQKKDELTSIQWKNIFSQAVDLGISFILLAGGEPLMRKDIILTAAGFPQIVFPIFTNGTMIDEDYLSLFNKKRNLVPVISIEGDRYLTDTRRGEGIYDKLTSSMNTLRNKNILFGTSVTVTTENLNEVTGAQFISELNKNGCGIIFYVEYVPVDGSTSNLAFNDSHRIILEQKIILLTSEFPNTTFLSFPGDEKKFGGCLAAGRGFFHVNAIGGAEPCPFSPYSDISLKDHTLVEALQSPLFKKLASEGILLQEHTGGCVLFENQEKVKDLFNT